MSYLQRTNESVGQFINRSSTVDQLQKIYASGIDNELSNNGESGAMYIGRTYLSYLRVLKAVATLKDEEIVKLAEVEELVAKDDVMRAQKHKVPQKRESASKFSDIAVLDLLGQKGRKALFDLAVAGADVSSPIFSGALEECVQRLEKGSQLAAAGVVPSDTNPIWDDAYFGHTRGLSPKVMVHFVISHYLTRTFQAKYKYDDRFSELAFDKDALHGVLSVGIRVMKARGTLSPEVERLWNSRLSEGGLQWHNDKYDPNNKNDPKQHFYDEAFKPS